MTNFPFLSNLKNNRNNFSKYTIEVKKNCTALLNADLFASEAWSNFFIYLFSIEVESSSENLQLEMIDHHSYWFEIHVWVK